MKIDKKYLREHPDHIFVFGDNLLRKGKGGAAAMRDEPNTYGFITKKAPYNNDSAFYKPDEYVKIFATEMLSLLVHMASNLKKTYLISKIGSGLANRHGIWEQVVKQGIEVLRDIPNVIFLWEE